jgi:hypothetical protein
VLWVLPAQMCWARVYISEEGFREAQDVAQCVALCLAREVYCTAVMHSMFSFQREPCC